MILETIDVHKKSSIDMLHIRSHMSVCDTPS